MKPVILALALLIMAVLVLHSEEIPSCNVYSWMMRPMSWKGREACLMRFNVFQVIDERTLLLEIFGSSEMGHQSIFYGRISKKVNLEPLVDGQTIIALVEIKGTKTYTTPIGSVNTVPLVAVKSITAL